MIKLVECPSQRRLKARKSKLPCMNNTCKVRHVEDVTEPDTLYEPAGTV